MKKRIMNIILVIMVILFPIMFVNAESNVSGHVDHPGSENCIYSCVLDEINIAVPEVTSQNVSGHIDHPGSENCMYSCVLDEINTAAFESSVVATHETEVLIDEAVRNFVAEYLQIPAEDVDLDAIRSTIAELAKDDQSSSSCWHDVFASGCFGSHSYIGNCTVLCNRLGSCILCGEIVNVTFYETSHSWSTGWCGQTCTVCGKIELFHLPGGCWFCS